MSLSDAAKQSGATEDTARTFEDHQKSLEDGLQKLNKFTARLSEAAGDKNLGGLGAVALIQELAPELRTARDELRTAASRVIAAHKSAVAKPDGGSLETASRKLLSHQQEFQHPLTRLVTSGVNEHAEEIINLVSGTKQEYPFLPGRRNEMPDPHIPSQSLAAKLEQALTHAAHEATSADNPDVLATISQKLALNSENYATFLTEMFQDAGYYREPGSMEQLQPHPKIFAVLATTDYLRFLPPEALNTILTTLAEYKSNVHNELAQFLAAIPEDKKSAMHYDNAFKAAALNTSKREIGNRLNVEAFAPYVSQAAKDDAYKAVACFLPRHLPPSPAESQALKSMGGALLAMATKPLSPDIVADIAKTGLAPSLEKALENIPSEKLPEVLAQVAKPPVAASEDNMMALLKKAEAEHVSLPSDTLSMTLDSAVQKGKLNLLKTLVDMPSVWPLLNVKDTRSGHENEGGNRILYKAAWYVAPGNLTSKTPKEKRADVEKALAMMKILHNEGKEGQSAQIPVIHGARGQGTLNILSKRIATDAPDLESDDYFMLLRSRLKSRLAADEARAVETTRLEVQQAHGLLGTGSDPVQQRRLMLAQLSEEADAMGFTGADKQAHIREGFSFLNPQGPQRLAIGQGAAPASSSTPATESPPVVKREGAPEVIDAEIVHELSPKSPQH